MNSLAKKYHITLIVASAIGMVLLYTTMAFALIGVATGLTFVAALLAYIEHKKTGFAGTKKIDWILMLIVASIALVLMLTHTYNIQALVMIFLAAYALVKYFMIYSKESVV